MNRLCWNNKIGSFEWHDWKPFVTTEFGASCVKKSKYVEDKVRINNNEVSTGTNRTALYTMPGGVDNGVRYSPLYESSGLDITEIEANKNIIANAKTKVEDMIKEDVKKTLDKISTETADKVSQKSSSSASSLSSSE